MTAGSPNACRPELSLARTRPLDSKDGPERVQPLPAHLPHICQEPSEMGARSHQRP